MSSININLGFAGETVDKGFKYKDISLPITKDNNKFDFSSITDVESIKNGIKNIFLWRKGQRVLNPEFGNVIYDMLYEPINDITARNIGSEIRRAFELWEPRVAIQQVVVSPDEDNNQYNVQITYTIPTVNNIVQSFIAIL